MPAWLPRTAPAIIALAIPVVAFLFNSFISQQERGFFDLSDVIAAIGFGILAYMAWLGSRIGMYAGIALCAVYLLSAILGGPPEFVAYWIVAIAALLWTVRYSGAPTV